MDLKDAIRNNLGDGFSFQILYDPAEEKLASVLESSLISQLPNEIHLQKGSFVLKENQDSPQRKMLVRQKNSILTEVEYSVSPYLLPDLEESNFSFLLLHKKPKFLSGLKQQFRYDNKAVSIYCPGMFGEADESCIAQKLIQKCFRNLGVFLPPEQPERTIISELTFVYDIPSLCSCNLLTGERMVRSSTRKFKELFGTYWKSRAKALEPTGSEFSNRVSMVTQWFQDMSADGFAHVVFLDKLYENAWVGMDTSQLLGQLEGTDVCLVYTDQFDKRGKQGTAKILFNRTDKPDGDCIPYIQIL